ncbi:MAG: hypothetical protein HQL51_12585 [Magnetococcales bacterium]|nr:hypothetical protein [Magnetococcales bacterium]
MNDLGSLAVRMGLELNAPPEAEPAPGPTPPKKPAESTDPEPWPTGGESALSGEKPFTLPWQAEEAPPPATVADPAPEPAPSESVEVARMEPREEPPSLETPLVFHLPGFDFAGEDAPLRKPSEESIRGKGKVLEWNGDREHLALELTLDQSEK